MSDDVHDGTGDLERLSAELESARAELLASFEGISRAAFERVPEADDAGGDADAGRRRSVRDLLWHVGLVEDWTRRTVDQGVNGRDTAPYEHRDRPAIAQAPEYLVAWLEQCHRPLRALLRRLPEDTLDRPFTITTGESQTPRQLLEHLAAHDREHAAQIAARVTAFRGDRGDEAAS